MSKIKKSELIDIVREQGSAITNLLQRVTFLENPHLKHLDQSVFDGLDEKWRFAAVDSDGSRAVFTSDNITQKYGKHYVNALSGEVKQILGRVDASNWQNSLIERDTAKKQLDQSIFDGIDKKWRWAAFNTPSNSPVLFSVKPYESMRGGWYAVLGRDEYMILGELEGVYEYTDDWQSSLIERDTAELLEVDLSSELTGSELCRAMLARGDKYVMCKTSSTGEAEAMESKYPDVIQKYDWEFFYTPYKKRYAVPINKQGEPLSAAEAGF